MSIEVWCYLKCIHDAMVRDNGYRQLKRYFVNMFNMPDEQAATLPISIMKAAGCSTYSIK